MEMVNIVDLLVNYYARQKAREGRPPNALGDPVLDEMDRYVQAQLEQHTGFITLYESFQKNPTAMSAELTGALESIIEGDPAVREFLNAFMHEYDIVTHTERTGPLPHESGTAEAEEENLDSVELPGTENRIVDQTDDYYEGEYLYGTANTRRGSESEGRVIDVNEDVSEGLSEDATDLDEIGMHIERFPGIFTQVSVAIQEHPQLSPQVKDQLLQHLEAISSQVAREMDANMGVIRQNLYAIQRLSPDILNILMNAEGFQEFLQNPNEAE